MKKNQNGITLIALVITIIVLLILAGVSIAMLTGENGILTKATESGTKNDFAAAEEVIKLAVADIIATNEGAPTGGFTQSELQTAIARQATDFEFTVDSGTPFKITVKKGEKDVNDPTTKKPAEFYVAPKTGKISTDSSKATP